MNNNKSTIFTSEDFNTLPIVTMEDIRIKAAEIANRKIESLLGPKVYGIVDSISEIYDTKPGTMDTHTAYLFNITELPKQPCNHVPVYDGKGPVDEFRYFCKHCRIELVSKWEPKP